MILSFMQYQIKNKEETVICFVIIKFSLSYSFSTPLTEMRKSIATISIRDRQSYLTRGNLISIATNAQFVCRFQVKPQNRRMSVFH